MNDQSIPSSKRTRCVVFVCLVAGFVSCWMLGSMVAGTITEPFPSITAYWMSALDSAGIVLVYWTLPFVAAICLPVLLAACIAKVGVRSGCLVFAWLVAIGCLLKAGFALWGIHGHGLGLLHEPPEGWIEWSAFYGVFYALPSGIGLVPVLAAMVLHRVWRRVTPPGVCRGCGYEVGPLRRCPECGAERV